MKNETRTPAEVKEGALNVLRNETQAVNSKIKEAFENLQESNIDAISYSAILTDAMSHLELMREVAEEKLI